MTTATSNPGVLPVWQKWPGMDPVLLTAVLSLLGFSMVMVFSAVAALWHGTGGRTRYRTAFNPGAELTESPREQFERDRATNPV
ncbi:MAG TPA: hypothetical protein EYO82_01870 [Gammaproteobacteria bacterium]|nr:hypothetical protein [Gammaproteobacteria bacterium]